MRVLVATDGRGPATVACAVVGTTPWPAGSKIRIVSVAGEDAARSIELDDPGLRRSLAAISRDDVVIDLRHGDPADEIVEAAVEFDADLVVVGCPALGPWATVPVGSVCAAVVAHAPCPVLVVRGRRLEPIVLATDGSEGAARAETMVRRWPRCSPAPVRVVSVRHRPVLSSLSPDRHEEGAPPGDEVAEATSARLLRFGIPASPLAVDGDPADGIVRVSREVGAGLIVVGTRGRTGLTRLVLGSVARKVLTHAACSVLVVRPTARRIALAEPLLVPAAGA